MLALGGVLADARAMWRRDGALLISVAALFIFLPLMALELLLPPLPDLPAVPAGTANAAAFTAATRWMVKVAPWCALAMVPVRFGMLTTLVLYLDPRRPALREALARAAMRLPGFYLLVMLLWMPIGIGGLLLLLPGVYVAARLSLLGAAMAAGQGGLGAALRDSVGRTRGSGLQLLALFTALTVAPLLAWMPLALLLGLLQRAVGEGEAMTVLVALGVAALFAAALQAAALFQVSAYRRLEVPISGT